MPKSDQSKLQTSLVLPVGTQVVTAIDQEDEASHSVRRSGAVGKIGQAPQDNSAAYLVQFPDGQQAHFYRHELSIRKHLQKLSFDRPDAANIESQLYAHIIFRCIVGSRAFGLETDSSDIDRRGIFLPPAKLHWSIYGIPEQIENDENQECYWELQKFLVLCLKANPNVLECLYSPLVEHASPLASELLANRERFLSKLVYQTYNGYVLSQFRKLEQDLRTKGELKWKHVMHLVRLLVSGITILNEEYVPVKVDEYRDKFMQIRTGLLSWGDINEWRLELHKEFDQALLDSTLPERPDYDWADEFLIKARKQMVQE